VLRSCVQCTRTAVALRTSSRQQLHRDNDDRVTSVRCYDVQCAAPPFYVLSHTRTSKQHRKASALPGLIDVNNHPHLEHAEQQQLQGRDPDERSKEDIREREAQQQVHHAEVGV
jgi:uncharacterized protein YjhX (UPF0386 family)